MKPSTGRIVHYIDENYLHRAALVTHVWSDDCVNLIVFGDGSHPHNSGLMFTRTSVMMKKADLNLEQTWHWPERVD